MNLYEGVHPYAARPGVDVEDESIGEDLRSAIWDLFEGDICNEPCEIMRMFDSLFTDIAIAHGWFRDPDGGWYMPVLYKAASS